jgi:hypothetical protein
MSAALLPNSAATNFESSTYSYARNSTETGSIVLLVLPVNAAAGS